MAKIVMTGKIRWVVPDPEDATAWLKATHGEQYDHVERAKVKGGAPLLWRRIPPWSAEEEAAFLKRRPELMKRRA